MPTDKTGNSSHPNTPELAEMQAYFAKEELSPTDGYVERNVDWFRSKILPRFIELGLSGNLLDIGCAKGYFDPAFVHYFNHIDAIDFSEARIQSAKGWNQCPNIDYYVHDVCHQPLSSNTYDWAYSSAVFQHMTLLDRKSALHNITDSLKPGGRLVCFDQYTWIQRSFKNGYAPLSYQFLRSLPFLKLASVKFVCYEGQGLPIYRIVLTKLSEPSDRNNQWLTPVPQN